MAKDGTPLNASNCQALRNIINYEAKNGKLATLRAFSILSGNPDVPALDASFESIGGPVSIDWMIQSGAGGLTMLPGMSMLTYGLAKQVNNVLNWNAPWTNIGGKANFNAPTALSVWIYNDISLAKMFAPALQECSCK